MESVGEVLRRTRESQGRSIADVAEELCITQRYLRAIEQDDTASLPGKFFYRSFVKQCASLLGIDYATLAPGLDAVAAYEPTPFNEEPNWPPKPIPIVKAAETKVKDAPKEGAAVNQSASAGQQPSLLTVPQVTSPPSSTAVPPLSPSAPAFELLIDPLLNASQVTEALDAIAEFFRASGGVGLRIEFETQEAHLLERVDA